MNDGKIARLQSLGLTENQAKAYTALLQLGRSTASALNKLSGVPRNKVYAVMEELNEKSLADILLEDPIVFVPRPISHFLELVVNDLEARRRELRDQADELATEFEVRGSMSESEMNGGSFRIYKGRRAVLQQHARMNREAKTTVRVVATPASVARTQSSDSLKEFEAIDGIEFEILTPLTDENQDIVREMHGIFGESLRISHSGPENVVLKVIDDREVMFTHMIPDSESITTGDDVGVWTDNPVFLRLALEIIARTRNQSQSLATAERVLGDEIIAPEMRIVQSPKERLLLMAEAVLEADEIYICAPSRDLAKALVAFGSAERVDKLRAFDAPVRVITDVADRLLAMAPEGLDIEVRHMNKVPATFAILGQRVMRTYTVDVEDTEAFTTGRTTLFTTLPDALREAKDHHERLWHSATSIELPEERPKYVPGAEKSIPTGLNAGTDSAQDQDDGQLAVPRSQANRQRDKN